MSATPSRSRWARVRGVLSHAGLLVALGVYTAVGGLVFRALEGPAEAGRLHALQVAVLEGRRELVAAVGNASQRLGVEPHGLAELRDLLHRHLQEYEAVLHNASRGGVEVPALTASPGAATPPRWTLLQGMFFAATVLTTIGYGNIAPVTLWGRVFCLSFALIGIPLTLSVIADMGVLLASAVSALPCWGSCRSWWALDDASRGTGTGMCRNMLLALAAVLLLFLYLAAGAAMFTLWEEGWDFFESFYFCFITMTTIGFGDLVPRQPAYTLLCTLYILVGLALTSTIIELVRRQYATSWRRLQEALSESGPALGDALRRLGTVPDVHLKGLLAAVSLARLVPQGGGRDELPMAPTGVDAQDWEHALAAVLREMEEKAKKEADKESEAELELLNRRREKGTRRPRTSAPREARLIEIVIYETTV
ncbi:potassium channel subfamily K member 15-like [Thrips palmi]|uniref:Potassium channel subfamily K member 15-like n=1 Tax=Thrips palmi TaxID=161013 RepID=A0A6P8Z8Y9_THRPL|nr:potassium channel subfamily K member 15-like [Thrips palmi]